MQALIRNDVGTLIVAKQETQEIELFKKPDAHKIIKPKTKALEEESYLSGIAQIIRRDFFPETAKLEAQHAYLVAIENNDVDALHAIYERYQTPRAAAAVAAATPAATPAAFETPSVAGSVAGTPRHGGGFETPMSEAGSATPRGIDEEEGEVAEDGAERRPDREGGGHGGGAAGRGGGGGSAGSAVAGDTDLEGDSEAFGKSIAAKKGMSLDKYLHMYVEKGKAPQTPATHPPTTANTPTRACRLLWMLTWFEMQRTLW